MEFIILTGLKKSEETINTTILITDGVGESDLAMVTGFCHPNQAKIEACDVLSVLLQYDLSELSVVVVRRYSNTLYIPRGSPIHSILMSTLFQGVLALPNFLLDKLLLCWLLPVNRTEVLLPCEVGEEGLETHPHLSNPISLSVP